MTATEKKRAGISFGNNSKKIPHAQALAQYRVQLQRLKNEIKRMEGEKSDYLKSKKRSAWARPRMFQKKPSQRQTKGKV
jgi:hypothetical protein